MSDIILTEKSGITILEVPGIQGRAGTYWRAGTGIPSNSLGLDGDFYVDKVTGDVYLKISGSYVYQFTMHATTGSFLWGTITGTLSNQTDLQNALNAKQNNLGFTPENVANKSQNIAADHGSTTKYPSVAAVEAFLAPNASDTVAGLTKLSVAPVSPANPVAFGVNDPAVQLTSNLLTAFQPTPDNTHYPSEKLVYDSLNAKQNILGYTAENQANKVTVFASPTDTQYPSALLVSNSLATKVNANTPITPGTATKVTYDAQGLILSGTAATTADINDSTNRRYITDAQQIVLQNTSGVNTGDQDLAPYALISSLGSAAYQPTTAFEVPLTFGTGLTRIGNTITRNPISLTTDVTGNLPVENLNSGIGATGTTFWCGDGTWKTPAGSGSGTVTSFSADPSLDGLFTTSVDSPTSNPVLHFALQNTSPHFFFGNPTGSIAAPQFAQPSVNDLSDTKTGTGNIVLATSPNITTPVITSPTIAKIANLANAAPNGIIGVSNNDGTLNFLTPSVARNPTWLNIDERTVVNNSNYSIQPTDRYVATSSTQFTTARTWTLPLAASLNPGQGLVISDDGGAINGPSLLIITVSGADKINRVNTSVTLSGTYSSLILYSDGSSNWTIIARSPSQNVIIYFTPGTSTYTPSVGTKAIYVVVIGAGGGGGSAQATTGLAAFGAGGGGGGLISAYIAPVSSSYTVTVGSGGVAGTAGGAGGNGGTTQFTDGAGSLMVFGGQGGSGASSGGTSVGFVGQGGSGGQPNLTGAYGIYPIYRGTGGAGYPAFRKGGTGGNLGSGGNSALGFSDYVGDLAVTSDTVGTSPGVYFNYGVGGGGAASIGSGIARSGGSGAQGLVVITEFY